MNLHLARQKGAGERAVAQPAAGLFRRPDLELLLWRTARRRRQFRGSLRESDLSNWEGGHDGERTTQRVACEDDVR